MNTLGEWQAFVPVVQFVIATTAVIAAAWTISWFLPRSRPIAREGLWQAALVGVMVCPLVPLVAKYAPVAIPALPLLPQAQVSQLHKSSDATQATGSSVSASSSTTAATPAHLSDATTSVDQFAGSPVVAGPDVREPVGRDPPVDKPAVSAPVRTAAARPRAAFLSPDVALRGFSLVWIAGVLFFLSRGIYGRQICRRLLTKSVPFDEGRYTAELSQLRGTLGTTSLPRIVVSAEVGGPLVIGVWRPCIVLPAQNLAWMTSRQLVQILLHESAHIVRRDPLMKLVQNLTCGLYWPHPLVHWLNVKLSQAREEVCDNFVLAHCEPADYAETLLQITERSPRRSLAAGGLAMLPERGSLETRIAGLLDPARDRSICWPRSRRWSMQLTLLLVPMLLGLIRVTTRDAHSAEPARAATAIVEEPAAAAKESSAPAGKGTGRITGQVVRAKEATAVAGAEVILLLPLPKWDEVHVWPLPVRRTTSDSQGNYAFDGLVPGRYHVWANFEKLTSRQETLRGNKVLIPETDDAPQSVTLRLVPGMAVTAHVKEKETGQPIKNAIVHFGLGNLQLGNFATDGNGRITVQPLGAGPWQIEAWVDGFARQRQELNLEAGSDAEVEFALAPGGDIEGTVRDPSGNPLAGAELGLALEGEFSVRQWAFSDAEGHFRLENLPLNFGLLVSLWKADYLPTNSRTRATEPKQSQDFTLQPRPAGGSVAGQVVDEEGRPIAGAVLRNSGRMSNRRDGDYGIVSAETREATTDADGQFRLDNLYHPPGIGGEAPVVLIRAKKFAPQRLPVKPGPSDNPTEMKITLKAGRRIRGRVADDEGRPVPGVFVSVSEGRLVRSLVIGNTDVNGEFEFDTLPNDAQFTFEKSGYVPLENRKFPVDTDEVPTVTMTPTGVIVGRVIDSATGKPIRKFHVRIQSNRQNSGGQRMPGYFRSGREFQSEAGKFILGELVGGASWVVMVDSAGYARQTTEPVTVARVAAAEAVEIKLDPVDPASLVTYSGRLLDSNKLPVPGAQLRLIAARDRQTAPGRYAFPYPWNLIRLGQLEVLEQANLLRYIKAVTDKDGGFTFADIPRQAEVELVWWGDGVMSGRADHLDQRLADAQGKPIEIVLPRAARVSVRINRQAFPNVRFVSVRAADGSNDFGHQPAELKPDRDMIEIGGLAPGKYVVALTGSREPVSEGRRSIRPIASQNITLEEGQTGQVEFDQK